MPTLFRFFVIIALLGALGLSAVLAFAYLVTPEPREMTVPIAPERLQPRR